MDGTVFGTAAAAALMLIFQCCGVCVAQCVLTRESGGARLLIGSAFGSVMLHWFPVLFAFVFDFTITAHICAAALATLVAAVCLCTCKNKQRLNIGGVLSAFARRKFLWLVLAVAVFFGFLVLKSFNFKNGRIYSSQATYGDMSMHLSFITSLARQQSFPPQYSLLPGFRLSYPFLSDSISSSLYIFGASLRLSYSLPMLLAGAQVLFGFYLFAARFLKSHGKAAFAWLLFFFNGGFGFVYFINGEKSLSDLLHGFYQTPTNLVEKNIRWVNVIVDMMLPQRATLFGWAVLFPLLYILYRAVFEGEHRYFAVGGILAGALPMIHTHSFLAAALICGAWLACKMLTVLHRDTAVCRLAKVLALCALPIMNILCEKYRYNADSNAFLWFIIIAAAVFVAVLAVLICKNIRLNGAEETLTTWGVLFVLACATALPQLCYWTFRQVGENGMLRGHFGWVITDGVDGYLMFYLKNIGLAAVLALGGIFTADSKTLAKLSPSLLIWLVAEFVEFQPNNYDNNKLLYVAYAFLCCAAAEFIFKLLSRMKARGLREAAVAAVLAVCVPSAVMTMARECVAEYEIFGTGAIALTEFVEENTEPDAKILTDTRHNNEIASLTGRNIVCGSSSYLYFHGLPYQKYETLARYIYENPIDNANVIDELAIDYILVSDFERSTYQVNEEEIAALCTEIYNDGVRVLYKVEKGGALQ